MFCRFNNLFHVHDKTVIKMICYLNGCKIMFREPSWSWWYTSWIYNYICNQCLSPLNLWFRIPLRRGVLDITLCDKVCQWLATGRWFSPGVPVSSTNKTDCHDITEILLKVALNTKHLNHHWISLYYITYKYMIIHFSGLVQPRQ